GVRVTVPVPQILVGDVLRIAPGRALPTDARVTTKGGLVSLAVLNGEADPKDVVPGDDVPAGAIVERMALEVVATRDPRDSTLARLAALVEQARQRRSRVERLADILARVLVIAVAIVAAVAFVVGQRIHGFEWGLSAALAVALIACPCS